MISGITVVASSLRADAMASGLVREKRQCRSATPVYYRSYSVHTYMLLKWTVRQCQLSA